MEYDSDGRRNRKSATAGDRVIYVNKFNRKASRFYDRSRLYTIENIIVYSLFFEFMLAKHERKFRSVYWNVKVFKNVWQRADMVFMPVGKKNSSYSVFVLKQIIYIWDNLIDTGHFRARKRQPRVYYYYVFSVFESGHVFTYLAYSA